MDPYIRETGSETGCLEPLKGLPSIGDDGCVTVIFYSLKSYSIERHDEPMADLFYGKITRVHAGE